MKIFVLFLGVLCLLHAAVAVVQFEQSSYEINEDIGLADRALRVCVFVDESSAITVTTSSGTANENEDFDVFNEVLDVRPGTEDGCFGIVIWEDTLIENDEQFTIAAVDELGQSVSTTVTILNDDTDDNFFIRFINGTPLVQGLSVTFSLEIGSDIERVECLVSIPGVPDEPMDCSSGQLVINQSRPRNVQIQAIARVVEPVRDVPFEIIRTTNHAVRGRCAANLIDDGVVIDEDSRDVTVTFRLTEQQNVDPSMVGFRCRLTGPVSSNIDCTSPVLYSGLNPGDYTLRITPNTEGGCTRRLPLDVTFTVTNTVTP